MILTAMTLSYVSTFYIKPCKLCVYGEEQKKELYYLQLWILQLANYLDIMKTFLFFLLKDEWAFCFLHVDTEFKICSLGIVVQIYKLN